MIYILGHWIAEKAGVLHRDVSLGNILIADNPLGNLFRGFLHDFDYSSMVEFISGVIEEIKKDPDVPEDKKKEAIDILKERTVSL